ncbi:MAG: cupin domain-containing protein [Pyrinomonadaceae bacterium]
MKEEFFIDDLRLGEVSVDDGHVSAKRLFKSAMRDMHEISISAGAELKEHSSPQPAVVVFLAGTGTFRLRDEEHQFHAGTCVSFEADVKHSVSAETDARLLLIKCG